VKEGAHLAQALRCLSPEASLIGSAKAACSGEPREMDLHKSAFFSRQERLGPNERWQGSAGAACPGAAAAELDSTKLRNVGCRLAIIPLHW
jgi:hypothetical protein